MVEREVVVEAEEEKGASGKLSSPSKIVPKSMISWFTTACSNLAPARQLSGSVYEELIRLGANTIARFSEDIIFSSW